MTFLEIQFRAANDRSLTISERLRELYLLALALKPLSPEFAHWFLQGESVEDALQHEVFDNDGPTTAALAVLSQELKKDRGMTIFGLWNGDETETGSTMSYLYRLGLPCVVRVEFGNVAALANEKSIAKLIDEVACIWRPSLVQLSSLDYHDEKVFADRPGVGWMLYLPRKLTGDLVPEARALIPVMHDKQQMGTIIVSQTDEIFDANNPEHVAVSNAIEVRLVDQDLLPLYSEL